ncbi:MAG: SO_0444 family Cu/Zn efflux transporter [Bacteroidia bacterium]|nr:SO_0444 family Cu/Zn efflux transporter [Bacteroidia bacterium]
MLIIKGIIGILYESLNLLNDMSIYLVFGFLFAGILHILISTETIAKHLGKSNYMSVIKSSLFGVPLPLCSCGVIPAAISLRKSGASPGAVISFLISTPTTGIDSIFATYSLMGFFFAIFRILASFFTGIFAGIIVNIFVKQKTESDNPADSGATQNSCFPCGSPPVADGEHSVINKIKRIFQYAFIELFSGIAKWLVIGILIGGIISYFIPDDFFVNYIGKDWQEMFIMLIIGIPIYVCATGSIPIASALMLKGMSPGAAFIFLLAGPATNAVTITVIGKEMGKKTTFLYLISILISSITFGFLINALWTHFNLPSMHLHHQHQFLPSWLHISATIILLSLVVYFFIRNIPVKINFFYKIYYTTGQNDINNYL